MGSCPVTDIDPPILFSDKALVQEVICPALTIISSIHLIIFSFIYSAP